MIQSDVIGAIEFKNRTGGAGAAAVEDGHGRRIGRIVEAFNGKPRFPSGEQDIRRQAVSAVVYLDNVSRVELVTQEERAQRGHGRRRRQAVVVVIASRGSPVARL